MTSSMDRAAFFVALRKRNSGVFGTSLSKGQVQGVEAILDACAKRGCDIGQTAYNLSTGYGETGAKMQPVRENLYYRASQIAKHFGPHRRQGKTPSELARNPRLLGNTVYGGEWGLLHLGNTTFGDGYDFRGFGIGQWTGRRHAENIKRALGIDVVARPELLDDIETNALLLVTYMMDGLATGHKLPYFVRGSKRDYMAARKVWGGVDASKYVGYAKAFERALEAGGWSATTPKPKPPAAPSTNAPERTKAQPKASIWASIFSAIFGGGKRDH